MSRLHMLAHGLRAFIRFGLIGGAVAGLTACASLGKEYPADKVANIKVGVTSAAEIERWFGPSWNHSTHTTKKDSAGHDLPSPAVFQVTNYFFGKPLSGDGVLPSVQPRRWLNTIAIDGVVIAYYSASSFKADSSDFDVSLTSMLKKGKTTEAEVIAALGNPSGRGIYPYAASPKGHALFYLVDLYNHPPGSTTKKRASIYIDEAGLVEDFYVDAHADLIPVAPAPVTVPVYIPPVRIKTK